MFKKFLTNKKGDIALLALILIPVLISLFTSVICAGYRETNFENRIQTELDNVSLVASKFYATATENIDGSSGKFHTTLIGSDSSISKDDMLENKTVLKIKNKRTADKQSFQYVYETAFEHMEGYNEFWETYMYITLDENGNEMLNIKVRYVIPNLSNSLRVISNFGSDSFNEGWYKENPKTWSAIKDIINTKLPQNSDLTDKDWRKASNSTIKTGIITTATACI